MQTKRKRIEGRSLQGTGEQRSGRSGGLRAAKAERRLTIDRLKYTGIERFESTGKMGQAFGPGGSVR